MASDRLLTTQEVLDYLQIKDTETLATYREAGLPFYCLDGRTYRYRREDVDGWLASQFRRPREVSVSGGRR